MRVPRIDFDSRFFLFFFLYVITIAFSCLRNDTAKPQANRFCVCLPPGGEILLGDYVNATTSLPMKWQGFTSAVDMMIYYVAISTASVPVIDCDHVV